MPVNERIRPNFNAFRGLKPQPVAVADAELIRTSALPSSAGRLPLVIEPTSADLDLCGWAKAHRPFIDSALLEHGALLFRNFGVQDAVAFEQFASTVTTRLFDGNGEHPRVGNSGNVYTPVFYPPEKKLLWHNENSFNCEWPLHILFGCVQPSATGGETPIVDSRRVFDRIPSEIRERFMAHGVLYQRNFGASLGLDWRTVFRTEDQAEVERQCREQGFAFEWKSGGRLRTRCVRPAAIRHPQTAEWSWFNQAQHWHIACLDEQVRESFLESFPEEDLPRSCYYGDGSPIEDAVMRQILDVYQSLEVAFPWRPGDVMFLDNVLVAHARNAFTGKRRLLVALGAMTQFDQPR